MSAEKSTGTLAKDRVFSDLKRASESYKTLTGKAVDSGEFHEADPPALASGSNRSPQKPTYWFFVVHPELWNVNWIRWSHSGGWAGGDKLANRVVPRAREISRSGEQIVTSRWWCEKACSARGYLSNIQEKLA